MAIFHHSYASLYVPILVYEDLSKMFTCPLQFIEELNLQDEALESKLIKEASDIREGRPCPKYSVFPVTSQKN